MAQPVSKPFSQRVQAALYYSRKRNREKRIKAQQEAEATPKKD